jgi:hypothetical protein
MRCLDNGPNRRTQQYQAIFAISRYVHPSDDAVLGAMERMGGHKIGHSAENSVRPARTQRQLTQ